ncbi:MAG: SURF1 family protein [Aestuariibacter sp.]
MLGTKKLKLIIAPTLITLVAFVILFRLGWWQLHRAEQKEQQLTQYASQGAATRQTLEQLVKSESPVQHARIQLQGTVAHDKLFYWDNRIKDGLVGYEVLGLLKTNVGTVTVNFGWLPAEQSRAVLPKVELPKVLHNHSAILYEPKNNVFITETLALDEKWPKRIQQPDLELMAAHFGQALLPYVAVLEGDTVSELSNNYTPVVMPPEKHIAYAIQWFGLALAVLIVFYFAVKKKLINDTE